MPGLSGLFKTGGAWGRSLPCVDRIELLTGILAKTGDIVEGVRPDQYDLTTPCPEYDVRSLLNHIVGWIEVFDAGCHDRAYEGDATEYKCGADPGEEFRTAAASLVAGWEEHGFDREVRVTSGKMPADMVFNMTVMEYLTHGWDLATATRQPVLFTEDEATETLKRAETTLPPEYRGEGMPFGTIVAVPSDAPAISRVVAFLGRQP